MSRRIAVSEFIEVIAWSEISVSEIAAGIATAINKTDWVPSRARWGANAVTEAVRG